MSSVVGGKQLVADFPYVLGREAFKRTDNGSELMNVDGRPSGTEAIIWNGTGASDTGGDWTHSGVGSESSSADAGDGTNGLDTGTAGANTNSQFNNGSEIDVAGSYSQLSFKLNPQAFPGNGRLEIQWRNSVSTVIGSTLDVENYVPNMDTGVWKTVTIPIADFNLTADVQTLQITYKVGTQRHYIDDIALQASGGSGPFIYRIGPQDETEVFHLSMAVLLLVSPTSGWDSDAFANIAGGLTNGLIMRHRDITEGTNIWDFVTKDNIQLFGQFHPQESFNFADSNLLVGFMVKPGKANVLITQNEPLEFVVSDDLSSIPEMRAYCHFGKEVIG